MLMKLVTKLAASLAALGLSFNVLAAELNVYASMPEKYASQVLEQFTKETGIKVNFLRLSSGEVLSRLQAEKSNPVDQPGTDRIDSTDRVARQL